MTETATYVSGNNARLLESLPGMVDNLKGYFVKKSGMYGGLLGPADVPDLVQETSMRAVGKLRKDQDFVEVGNGFEGYVVNLFRNTCVDELNRRIKAKDRIKKGIDVADLPSRYEFTEGVELKELREILFAHIDQLPEIYKKAMLDHLNGTKGDNNANQRSRLERARQKLRGSLAALEIYVD